MHKQLRKHEFGFWEIVDKPTKTELQEYYADKYYQQAKGSYELEYSAQELACFRGRLEMRHAVSERLLGVGKVGRLLDVGCGEGYTLAFFRERGWSVRGIDFSAAGVDAKNPGCSDALLAGDIFDLLHAEIASGRVYDVVWLQNVLEHVLDPLELLRALRRLVSPSGIAVITVPNDGSIVQRAALEGGHVDREFWVLPPDHLSYFDYSSLTKTAAETGWSCKEVLADFPVDWFLFHPGSNFVRDPAMGKEAHLARVQLENVIYTRPMEDVIRFWSSMATLGMGRNITAFLRPAE